MKKHSRTLDTISGSLFLLGFLSSKLKNIPIVLISGVFNLVSILAYLIGYIAWYAGALLYPEHQKKMNRWYGFTDYKEQYQMAAVIGIIATIVFVAFPPLLIPACWLYTLSNLIWSISEYHKKENPPVDDERYSSVRQTLYVRYAALITISSAVVAISATISFLFPPASFIILITSTILGIALTIASLYQWGQCTFHHFPPDKVNHSYNKLSEQLSFPLQHNFGDNLQETEERQEEQEASPPMVHKISIDDSHVDQSISLRP